MQKAGKAVAALFALVALLVSAAPVLPAPTTGNAKEELRTLIGEASTQRELLTIARAGQAMQQLQRERALRVLESKRTAERMAEMARQAITPEMRVRVFRLVVLAAKARGVDLVERIHRERGAVQTLQATSGGLIEGTVKVDGESPEEDITVVAFDSLGYVADVTVTGNGGTYTLHTGPGKFYVMTVSNGYVDEMYEDVPVPFGDKGNWRAATLVEVTEAANAENIDFDLDGGAVVTGVVRRTDGSAVAGETVTLRLTSASDPTTLLTYEVLTDFTTGAYEIHVPAPGQYKLSARTRDLGPIWYGDQPSWADAQVLQINSTDDRLEGIDFTLPPAAIVGPAAPGGAISGRIQGPTFVSPVIVAFAVAFDASDTTVAGIGFSIMGNPYVIVGLEPGQYYVWANDVLGDVIRSFGLPTAENYLGEFYEDAHTPDEATLVEVTDNDTTADINFQLDKGASIEGTVMGPGNQPLDSVLVVAVDAEIGSAFDDPFFQNLQIEVALTDGDGNYKITGLTEGHWVLRTVSALKYFGAVLDEYYDGHHSLWDFDQADRVHVNAGQALTDIDFTLDQPGGIAGTVMDAQTAEPLPEALLLAINLNSGLPELAFGESGEDGGYTLGPLPAGNYAVLCVLPDEQHLSEFYNGAYSLAQATPVQVQLSAVTVGIDFDLELGATIAGFVKFPDGAPVGADTLHKFPVLAFEANSGKLADYAFAQFPGGFKIRNLIPGQYKVVALPIVYGYAATYAGGGATFGDPASTAFDLVGGDVVQTDIVLETAPGSISGTVQDASTGVPVSGAFVVAYDETGHAVGMGAVGFDLSSMQPTTPEDTYRIVGLRPGNYYVRTFAIGNLLMLAMQGQPLGEELPIIGEGGGLPDLSGLNVGPLPELPTLYGDLWYNNVPVPPIDLWGIDLYGLGLAIIRHGFAEDYEDDLIPLFLPLPFATQIPGEATAVDVGDGETTGINFQLLGMDVKEITAVSQEKPTASVPKDFALRPAYPNPFNPTTQIEWQLPVRTEVKLQVYNLLGGHVKNLVNGVQPAGTHSAVWDGTDQRGLQVPSGVYLIRLEAGNFRATQKVLLLK